MANPEEIIDFWMTNSKKWYLKDENFDKEIKTKFEGTLKQIANDELSNWMETPEGALAMIIVCDQFTRNMFRNNAESFAYDAKALSISKDAIKRGYDKAILASGSPRKLGILYMPFMHSESRADHEEALKLFDMPGLECSLSCEKKHKLIIDKFGRFCHRNEVLGRKSTPEEIEFMKENKGF